MLAFFAVKYNVKGGAFCTQGFYYKCNVNFECVAQNKQLENLKAVHFTVKHFLVKEAFTERSFSAYEYHTYVIRTRLVRTKACRNFVEWYYHKVLEPLWQCEYLLQYLLFYNGMHKP